METRLEKYKSYRESIKEMKAESRTPEAVIVRQSKTVNESLNTTSTLPLEDVVGKINEGNEIKTNRVLSEKSIIIIVLSAIGAVLVAGIIIFAIIAFRR